ncbi:DUF6308 family protein [Streptomyces sp. NPDC046939]|uniref:DUF6308 family protein n=1 Tax=Streptomyces sp. NPDC046939 TaxID=3155376 RepID=UPI0033FDFB0A
MTSGPAPDHHLLKRLHDIASAERTVQHLRRYFGLDPGPGEVPYTGSRFEHLAGGGDRPETANCFTADDLIAVERLSVRVPQELILELLEGSLGSHLSNLLSEVPTDLDLADADVSLLQQGSSAHAAYDALRARHGLGRTRVAKLLARKRPRLLPVYDSVVGCAAGYPDSWWCALHSVLRADNQALHRAYAGLRSDAGLPETVSVLRVIDVAVWMRHHDDHDSKRPTKCVWR